MTRHDAILMQINKNTDSLKADRVKSSACYLYPQHFSGQEFSIIADINHNAPLFLEVAIYHYCHFTDRGSGNADLFTNVLLIGDRI